MSSMMQNCASAATANFDVDKYTAAGKKDSRVEMACCTTANARLVEKMAQMVKPEGISARMARMHDDMASVGSV